VLANGRHGLTTRQKIDRVVTFLTHEDLAGGGGHPYDHTEYAGLVFVAALDDDGGTMICIYGLDELAQWYDRADAYLLGTLKDGDEFVPWPADPGRDWGVWGEAFWETA
jgi:hypothetical protein